MYLTSSIIRELAQTLDIDQEPRLCAENAFLTADVIVKEFLEEFQSMDKARAEVCQELGHRMERRIVTGATLDRLNRPFLQPKLEFRRSNLERLKSTLLLMLNVITYARQVANE